MVRPRQRRKGGGGFTIGGFAGEAATGHGPPEGRAFLPAEGKPDCRLPRGGGGGGGGQKSATPSRRRRGGRAGTMLDRIGWAWIRRVRKRDDCRNPAAQGIQGREIAATSGKPGPLPLSSTAPDRENRSVEIRRRGRAAGRTDTVDPTSRDRHHHGNPAVHPLRDQPRRNSGSPYRPPQTAALLVPQATRIRGSRCTRRPTLLPPGACLLGTATRQFLRTSPTINTSAMRHRHRSGNRNREQEHQNPDQALHCSQSDPIPPPCPATLTQFPTPTNPPQGSAGRAAGICHKVQPGSAGKRGRDLPEGPTVKRRKAYYG